MSVTNKKYWYYIDLGIGFYEVIPKSHSLILDHVVNLDWEAVVQKNLTGNLILKGQDFDNIISFLETNSEIPLKIYRDGTNLTGILIFSGNITQFNNYDFNSKIIEVKGIICTESSQFSQNELIRLLTNKAGIDFANVFCSQYPIRSNFFGGQLITQFSYTFKEMLNNAISNGIFLNPETPCLLDDTTAWFNVPLIDLTKLRICSIGNLRKNNTDVYGGAWDELSVEDFLTFLRDFLHAYWYCDGASLKFKSVVDFMQNPIDLSTSISQNKKRKSFTDNYNIGKETLSLHPNNYITNYKDWNIKDIMYSRKSKQNNERKSKFQTLYTRIPDINIVGWFIGYVNTSFNYIERGLSQLEIFGYTDNAELCNYNLMEKYISNYGYTNMNNVSIAGFTVNKPTYLKPFIQIPDIDIVFDDPENFRDSIIIEKTHEYQNIARIYQQSTDLSKNITKLKSFEFTKIYN
jgi:hypothetical protein